MESHIKCFHGSEKKRLNTSPLSSPPCKKLNNDVNDRSESMEVDITAENLLEIELEASKAVKRLNELHIKELEAKVAALENELELSKKHFLNPNTKVTNKKLLSSKLSKVHEGHIPQLHGYEVVYKVKGNGACLANAASVHLYGSENESKNLKRKMNKHIVENWDNFYCEKVALPFTETVGVGSKAKKVEITTREEMIAFLLSEDALYVFGRYHDMLALANMFNISIRIFTYKNVSHGNWNLIAPDIALVSKDVKHMGKCIEDMFFL